MINDVTKLNPVKVARIIKPQSVSDIVNILKTFSGPVSIGGSVSVNAHGRYVYQGPLIFSVKSLVIVLANGDVVNASPTNNSEIYYGAIGGYGAPGVIVEVTLELANNVKMERHTKARAITWFETDKALTSNKRVVSPKIYYGVERYFIWAILSTPFGKWRREYIIDPLLYIRSETNYGKNTMNKN